MATNITGAMLGGLRQKIVDMVSYGRYQLGGTWYRAEINSKAVQANGAVHVTFYIERNGSPATTATRFQLMNSAGQILAARDENVTITQYVNRILYRFKFGVSVAE